jgi:hypothetical protein
LSNPLSGFLTLAAVYAPLQLRGLISCRLRPWDFRDSIQPREFIPIVGPKGVRRSGPLPNRNLIEFAENVPIETVQIILIPPVKASWFEKLSRMCRSPLPRISVPPSSPRRARQNGYQTYRIQR